MESIKGAHVTKVFGNAFKGKKVLVTGHTGFKGSWLSMWLTALGADVIGYSAYFPSIPCNFKVCGLDKRLTHVEGDIRNLDTLTSVFKKYKPEIVFHLAAQPLVRESYKNPKLTFDTNIGGTVNVLECIRSATNVKAAVIITSDKCYRNMEWLWGYKETDIMGGDDPYSASKGCAEIICNSYIKSFFPKGKNLPRVATTRAGNVIGGGDWAIDRIVPDSIRAFSKGKQVIIRNPNATRPWQHVLEPLSGYLWLAAHLLNSAELHGEAFNFGPDHKVDKSVAELLAAFSTYWGEKAKWKFIDKKDNRKESTLLKLSCDKALNLLDWSATLSFEDTIRFTAEWYTSYYRTKKEMFDYSMTQIKDYTNKALGLNNAWAHGIFND